MKRTPTDYIDLPLKGPPLTRDVLRSDHPRRSSREAAVKQPSVTRFDVGLRLLRATRTLLFLSNLSN